MIFPSLIDNSWTLFLDRDGVINQRIINDYVKDPKDFVPIKGSLKAISNFNKIFGLTIVVTNQQGIGKGLMSEKDLELVHSHFLDLLQKEKGKVDSIYHAPQLAELDSQERKPNTGMALKAKNDFPSINFEKSVMIGDSVSDMQFGKALGMSTIFIGKQKNQWSDFHAENLSDIEFNK